MRHSNNESGFLVTDRWMSLRLIHGPSKNLRRRSIDVNSCSLSSFSDLVEAPPRSQARAVLPRLGSQEFRGVRSSLGVACPCSFNEKSSRNVEKDLVNQAAPSSTRSKEKRGEKRKIEAREKEGRRGKRGGEEDPQKRKPA